MVELLPLPPDENLRLRHGAYQRSTRSSTRIEGNPLDDEAVRLAVASSDRTGGKAEQEVRNYWRIGAHWTWWRIGPRAGSP